MTNNLFPFTNDISISIFFLSFIKNLTSIINHVKTALLSMLIIYFLANNYDLQK